MTATRRKLASPDGALLERIDPWRAELAQCLLRCNPRLSEQELDVAVRRAIQRILFLRICRDRGIERSGGLQVAAHGPKIDDRRLEAIAADLDGQGVLPIEVLGRAYEQSLGRPIRLDGGRGVAVETKSNVRKSGGVYYTPGPIVEYVVRHTLGKMLEGRTPKEVARLRVLDPACGAGAFLIAAYRCLLDWHRDWYAAHDPQRHARGRSPRLCRDPSGAWRLTPTCKRTILTRSIYGVDLDPQAVEVTRLSLVLTMLDGGDDPSDLPDLAGNVRCGNALIGPDFCRGRSLAPADDGRLRIETFDWPSAFPEVFRGETPGFDVVLGNPPWGQKAVEKDEDVKRYLRERFPSTAGIYDTFRPFVEQGLRLLAPGGRFGMVLPDIVLLKNYPQTRLLLLDSLALERIDWWGSAFRSAVIDAATILGQKGPASPSHRVAVCVRDGKAARRHKIPQADFRANPRYAFNLHLTPQRRAALRRLDRCPRLGDYFEVHEGVHSGNIRRELFLSEAVDGTCRPMYFGRGEIAPYRLQWEGRYIRLGALPKRKSPERYANLGRPGWYRCDKLLVRRTGDFVLAAVDRRKRYASNNFFLVLPVREHPLDLDGVCALLNSRPITWYFRAIEPRRGRVFAELKIKHLVAFPLPDACKVGDCRRLNRLGRRRAELAAGSRERAAGQCDAKIEALVGRLLSLPANILEEVNR